MTQEPGSLVMETLRQGLNQEPGLLPSIDGSPCFHIRVRADISTDALTELVDQSFALLGCASCPVPRPLGEVDSFFMRPDGSGGRLSLSKLAYSEWVGITIRYDSHLIEALTRIKQIVLLPPPPMVEGATLARSLESCA